MKFIQLALIALLATNSAFAAGEIIRQYRSARSLGMGGLVTTTGMYDDAFFGNPAMHGMPETWKLSILNLTAEVNDHVIDDKSKFTSLSGSSGSSIFTKVADSGIIGRNEHERVSQITGLYLPHFFSQNNSAAIGLFVNEQANVMLRSNIDLDIQALVDAGPVFGFARKFMDQTLYIGLNFRSVYRLGTDSTFKSTEFLAGKKLSLSDIGGQGMGLDGDLGAYYKIPFELPIVRFSAGASVNNLAGSNYDTAFKHVVKKVTSSPPKNYTNGNVGIRADFNDLFILTDNKVAFEVQNIGSYNKTISNWKRMHMGAETRLIHILLVRGGFNQGYYTAGVGLDLPLLKIDVTTYGEELGTNAGMLEDRRYVARVGLEI